MTAFDPERNGGANAGAPHCVRLSEWLGRTAANLLGLDALVPRLWLNGTVRVATTGWCVLYDLTFLNEEDIVADNTTA